MPIYDRRCVTCDIVTGTELYELVHDPNPPCPQCGNPTERIAGMRGAVDDSIPGGVEIKHGLCNPDGSPRRYYSHSEMRKEAAKRGLVEFVRHVPDRGSDKSKNTSRWY